MVSPIVWLSDEDKREYYEQLLRDAQEGEIMNGARD